MTKKSELAAQLVASVDLRRPVPEAVPDAGLLEQAMVAVLRGHMPQERAVAALRSLQAAYSDWNEARVAQVYELAGHLAPAGASRKQLQDHLPAVRDLRECLQEIFQKTHALDLEVLREDAQTANKTIAQLDHLGLATGHFLLSLTQEGLPVTTALIRVLDRVGLISRTASLKKAREMIEPLAKDTGVVPFVVAFGEVADRWCDPRKPICHECPLVDTCAYGKKAYQEWRQQQERLEVQRKKDEARRKKEEERERKRLDAEVKRAERERERKERDAQRQREREARDAQREADKRARAAAAKARQDAAKAAKTAKASPKKSASKSSKSPAKAAKPAPRKAPSKSPSKRPSKTPSKSSSRSGSASKGAKSARKSATRSAAKGSTAKATSASRKKSGAARKATKKKTAGTRNKTKSRTRARGS